ncbi:MAG: DUF1902 domain-containing protein [Rhodobacteraceae bacterium]|nr:DUF1902 domain-containing protein [Paracoccaceae bacterium]
MPPANPLHAAPPQPVSITVNAQWDPDARVWVATSTDIGGLAIESPTFEALQDKVAAALADLLELNGTGPLSTGLHHIPVHILARQTTRIPLPA